MARPDPLQRKAGQSEVEWYRQMVGAANKRLERLEKYSQQENYRAALNYAYEGAVFDIRAITPESKSPRFTLRLKKTKSGDVDLRDLHAKINAVKGFLESKTSTKTGITSMYQKRADTINQKYGTNYTWNELGRAFQKLKYTKGDRKGYGSGTVLKAIDALKKAGNKRELDAAIRSNQQLSSDAVVDEVAKDLASQGLTAADFIR